MDLEPVDLGAMGNLAPKMRQLLQVDYKLQKGVKAQVMSLAKELEGTHMVLSKVAQVPYDELAYHVKRWASKAQEASYDMDDVLDTLLVRLGRVNQGNMFSLRKLKARYEIARAIEGIKKQVIEITELYGRYMIDDDSLAYPAAVESIDPHVDGSELVGIDRSKDAGSELAGIDRSKDAASELVGIDQSKDELIKLLTLGDDKMMKIVSVVGVGGMGKTALAKVVYDNLTVDMNISCKAFVSIGKDPDLRGVFRDILLNLHGPQYMNNPKFNFLDKKQLIDNIQRFLMDKSKKLRRLSLKYCTWPKRERDVSPVRSIAVFGPCIDSMSSFLCLDMLRVLDLEGCLLKDRGGSKLSIGNLIHLRYLGLRGTGLKVFPGGIERLQFLHVLKMDGDIELPESIFGRIQLMCLDGVRCCPRPGNSLRFLASLQVLDTLYLDDDSVGAVEVLRDLKQLRVLEIFIKLEMADESFYDALMNSLGELPRLQFLRIMCDDLLSLERWAPHPVLWNINRSWLSCLRYLDIRIHIVGSEEIQIFGMLPNLVAFQLEADYRNYLEHPLQKFMIRDDAFQSLRRCFFRYVAIVPSMFTRGAMPLVEHIRFCLRAWDFFSDTGLKFADLAMDSLPSLKAVCCVIHGETDVTGEEEVKELREAVKRASDVHPNHPKLSILKEIGRA